MNMQAGIRMSAAEAALVEAYNQKIGELPGDSAVLVARDGLLSDLKSAGLPTRRVEAWYYTDLKALLRSVPAVDPSAVAEPVAPLVERSTVLAVLNGRAQAASVPDGVSLRPYSELLADGTAAADLVARGSDDAIARINGVFVRDGVALDIADDTEIAAPVEIQAVQNAGQAHTRFPVRFGANTKATLIEPHVFVREIDRRELHLGDADRRARRVCERIGANLVGRAFAGHRRRRRDCKQTSHQNGCRDAIRCGHCTSPR